MYIKCYRNAWHCDLGDMGEDSYSSVLSGLVGITSEFLILFPIDVKEINILTFSFICLPMGRVLVMYTPSEMDFINCTFNFSLPRGAPA